MESMRSQDMAAEAIVAQYLDRYFYPVAMPRVSCGWQRVRDRGEQFAGIDVKVALPTGDVVNIDEKAQVDYLRNPLPTFVLELGFLGSDGSRRQGWFVNDELRTDVYLFVWPHADSEKSDLTVDDIEECECMTVPKVKLRDALARHGWTAKELKTLEEAVRNDESDVDESKPLTEWNFIRDFGEVENVPGVKVRRSSQLREKPVNLVVKKGFLSHYATGHYAVYPGAVKVLERPEALSGTLLK